LSRREVFVLRSTGARLVRLLAAEAGDLRYVLMEHSLLCEPRRSCNTPVKNTFLQQTWTILWIFVWKQQCYSTRKT